MNNSSEAHEIDKLCKQITNPFTETLVGVYAATSVTMVASTGFAFYEAYQFSEEVIEAEEALNTAKPGEIEIDGHVFELPDSGLLEDYVEDIAPRVHSNKLETGMVYLSLSLCSVAITGTCVYLRRRQLDPEFAPFGF